MFRRMYRIGISLAIVGSLLCLPVVVMDTVAGASGGDGSSCSVTSIGGPDDWTVVCTDIAGSPSSIEEVAFIISYGGSYYNINIFGSDGTLSAVNPFTVNSVSGSCAGSYDGTGTNAVICNTSSGFGTAAEAESWWGTTGLGNPDGVFDPSTPVNDGLFVGVSGSNPAAWPYGYSTGAFYSAPTSYLPVTAIPNFAASFSSNAGSIVLPIVVALVGLLVLFWAIRFVFGFLRRRRMR